MTPELAEALEVLARVERDSSALAGAGRPRRLSTRGRFAVAEGVERARRPIRLPSGQWTDAASGPEIRADVVAVARVRRDHSRLRAFYVEQALTVVAHGGIASHRRRGLMRGSRIAERLAGISPGLRVPEQVERGRRLHHSWVVEATLPGRRVSVGEWEHIVPDLVHGFADLWLGSRLWARPIRHVVGGMTARRFGAIVRDVGLEHRVPGDLPRVLERLARSDHDLLVGPTHGDPVRQNVLRLDGGALGLVDWEKADERPLGQDLFRILLGATNPRRIIGDVATRLAPLQSPRAAPWHLQVAIGGLARMSSWGRHLAFWEQRGSAEVRRDRLARRLALMAELLW